jgi:hypothetical protein
LTAAIMTRQLRIVADGDKRDVEARLRAPVQKLLGRGCRFEIDWPEGPTGGDVEGPVGGR